MEGGGFAPAGGWAGYSPTHYYLRMDAPAFPSPQEAPPPDLPWVDAAETAHERMFPGLRLQMGVFTPAS